MNKIVETNKTKINGFLKKASNVEFNYEDRKSLLRDNDEEEVETIKKIASALLAKPDINETRNAGGKTYEWVLYNSYYLFNSIEKFLDYMENNLKKEKFEKYTWEMFCKHILLKVSVINGRVGKMGFQSDVYKSISKNQEEFFEKLGSFKPFYFGEDYLKLPVTNSKKLYVVKTDGYFNKQLAVLPRIENIKEL